MPSTAERAAQLRAQADALEALAALEQDLLAAKAAHAANPSKQTAAAVREAAEALRTARATARPEGLSVGGDAYTTKEG